MASANSVRYQQGGLTSCGLIILGNSGVGKSFIANLLLQKERFEHKVKPTAVTKKTEFEVVISYDTKYAIFNIPGLIEANQAEIENNKREIQEAFLSYPNSIIIYVFGVGDGGRIRDEDVIAFNALHGAYAFRQKSLMLVVNSIPVPRENTYEGEVITFLKNQLNTKYEWEICFLDKIGNTHNKREEIHKILLATINNCFPQLHKRNREIKLDKDEIKEQKHMIAERDRKLKTNMEYYQKTLQENRVYYERKRDQDREGFEKKFNELKAENASLKKQIETNPPSPVTERVHKTKLKCGGDACPRCNKCSATKCKYQANAGTTTGLVIGGAVGVAGLLLGPAGAALIPVGVALGGLAGHDVDITEHRCHC